MAEWTYGDIKKLAGMATKHREIIKTCLGSEKDKEKSKEKK